jgi:hypothetical protein
MYCFLVLLPGVASRYCFLAGTEVVREISVKAAGAFA